MTHFNNSTPVESKNSDTHSREVQQWNVNGVTQIHDKYSNKMSSGGYKFTEMESQANDTILRLVQQRKVKKVKQLQH